MIYKEYEEYRTKYYEAQKTYDAVLNEKEILFLRTQPSAIVFDKEIVSGGTPSNAFDTYLIAKEKKQIDARLEEAKSILEDREKLLEIKEKELKLSNNIYDKIYYYRCLENRTPTQISFLIPCDRTTVYRYMKDIERDLKKTGYGLHSIYARKQNEWQNLQQK